MPVKNPVDPWSAGILGATSIATAALTPPTATSTSSYTSSFDTSGFNVNVGDGSPDQTAMNTTPSVGSVKSLASNPIVMIFLAVALFFAVKKFR